MFVEVGLECERLSASLARVEFEGRMRLHVGAQVRPVGERFAAVRATERLFTGVRPQMTLKQPRTRERLVADGTTVLEVVR